MHYIEVHKYASSKQDNNSRIGRINIHVFTIIDYKVLIFPVIDISKHKTKDDMDTAAKDLQLNDTQIQELNTELNKRYQQDGINIIAEKADVYVEYNTKNKKYKPYKGWRNVKYENSGTFFSLLEEDFENYKNTICIRKTPNNEKAENDVKVSDPSKYPCNFLGTTVLLMDRNSEKINVPENRSVIGGNKGSTDKAQGWAYPGFPNCLLFKNSKTDYGIFVHEIGHTLGCIHTFMDSKKEGATSDPASVAALKKSQKQINSTKYQYVIDLDRTDKPKEFMDYLKNNPDQKKKYDKIMAEKDNEEKRKIREAKRLEIYADFYDANPNLFKLKQGETDYVSLYTKNKREKFDTLEKVLYTQGATYIRSFSTANVMDYADTEDDFFKWQCLMIRSTVKKHLSLY